MILSHGLNQLDDKSGEYFQSSDIANDLPFDTLGEYLSWGKGVSKVDIGER